MTKEEIKEAVEAFLKDKLDQIWFQSFERSLTQQQSDICKNNNNQNTQILHLGKKFNDLHKQLQAAQEAANQVVEMTERKIQETQKVKKNQHKKLEELDKNQNIQQQINSGFSQIIQSQQQQLQQQQQQQEQQQKQQQYQFQTQQIVPEGMVFRTRNGTKYHLRNCENVQKYQTMMIKIEEAREQNLTGCLICKS